MNRESEKEIIKPLDLTLEKICEVMGAEIPKNLLNLKYEKNFSFCSSTKNITGKCLYFSLFESEDLHRQLTRAIERGAVVLFVEKSTFLAQGLEEEDYPVILLENKIEQIGRLFAFIKNQYTVKTLTLTGTVGKTTTKMFLDLLFKQAYNTYSSPENTNSYNAVLSHIVNDLSEDTEIFIQEVGAASTNSVRKSARMLEPDGAILLNVTNHHINKYGNYEKLFEDKVSLTEYMQEDGIIVANFDDEGLANHQYTRKVVSIGVETMRDIDYRALNIEQNQELLEFDVLHNDKSTHVAINIYGTYNVINALAAFALANQFGISEEDITKGFSIFSTNGIRQNLQNVGGYHLFMDCYNCSASSMKAVMKTCESFKLSKGNKKIVVIGGENKLGESSYDVMYNTCKELASTKVDKIICFGKAKTDIATTDRFGYVQGLYDGFVDGGFPDVTMATTRKSLIRGLKKEAKRGDLILIKGVLWLDLAVAVDLTFGTSYAFNYEYYISRAVDFEEDGYRGKFFKVMDRVLLEEVFADGEKVVIPNVMMDKPVFGVKKRICQNNVNIKIVDFGNSLRNIGSFSFNGCSNLRKLCIPSNIRVIEQAAFGSCSSLKSVIIDKGTIEIGRLAFSNNGKLKKVVLPKSVGHIGPDAFQNCKKIKLIVHKNSYALQYAIDNNIKYKVIEQGIVWKIKRLLLSI